MQAGQHAPVVQSARKPRPFIAPQLCTVIRTCEAVRTVVGQR
jgi:hypothetical protein